MNVLFWLIAAALIGASLAFASRPLWRRRDAAPSTAAHEVSVYKSQLSEIERDLERGALSAEEAEGARREIARRLLAADAAMEQERAFEPAPPEKARTALLTLAPLMVGAALLIYALIGAPGREDVPFAARDLAAERSAALLTQAAAQARAQQAALPAPAAPDAESAALIQRMRAVLEQRPDDPQGRILLGRALLRLQRADEAWPLLARAAELLGEAAPEQLYAQLGEAMMLAAGGYVSREAEQAFARAPRHSISRYMLGVADAQRGDNRRALERWTSLYVEQRDAPFAPALLNQIRNSATFLELDVDKLMAGLGAPEAPAAPEPGPDADQLAAAAEMSPEEQQEMIEGMVSGLADRLREDPNDLAGWLRLVQAYGVLGRRDEAAAALATARDAFAADEAALAQLAAAERALPEARPQ